MLKLFLHFLILQDKAKQLFPKDTEITHQVVSKKLHEILSARGKKVSFISDLLLFEHLTTILGKKGGSDLTALHLLLNIHEGQKE